MQEERAGEIHVYGGSVRGDWTTRGCNKVCGKIRMQRNRAEGELVRLKHSLKFLMKNILIH